MKKYFIDNEEFTKKEFYDELRMEIEIYIDNNFDEIFDSNYEKIRFDIYSFSASTVLKNCYPNAYESEKYEAYATKLRSANKILEEGGLLEANGYWFKIEEVDE